MDKIKYGMYEFDIENCSQILPMEGLLNVRDLGGYKVQDGRHIRSHCLIRSGALSTATEHDKAYFTDCCGLKRIIDLRTPMEAMEKPDPEMAGVAHFTVPIVDAAKLGMTREEGSEFNLIGTLTEMIRKDPDMPEGYMSDLYATLTEEDSLAGYRRFFELVEGEQEGAVLWHCSAGKDRAGTATIFLLLLLGVDEETVLKDYLLTNYCLSTDIENIVKYLKSLNLPSCVIDGMAVLNSARETFIKRLFMEIRNKYGTKERFFEEGLHMTPERISQLRDRYLI